MKKIYFASDFHFGRDSLHTSAEREIHLCKWLNVIKNDAEKIYLVGDLFDYWYEYRQVIPRGNNLFKSTLIQLRQEGIPIEVFTGNHDLWMGSYFEEDLDIKVHRDPITVEHQGVSIHVGHGDGLGPGDYGYKFIKKIFQSKMCQWLFSRLHPNFAISFMKYCSNLSNNSHKDEDDFKSFEEEWLVEYVESNHVDLKCDYYIFGHRHLPIVYSIKEGQGQYINIGDWVEHYTYGVLEKGKLTLKQYLPLDIKIYTNVGTEVNTNR